MIFARRKQLEGHICSFSLIKKSVLAIKSVQKSATKKSAKKRAKYSSNKSMRTFKSAQKMQKKVLLLIKVPKKAL